MSSSTQNDENRRAWAFLAIVGGAVYVLCLVMAVIGLKAADAQAQPQARGGSCPAGQNFHSFTANKAIKSVPFGTELAYGVRRAEMCDRGDALHLRGGGFGSVITTSGDRSGWYTERASRATNCLEGSWDHCKRAAWKGEWLFATSLSPSREHLSIRIVCDFRKNCSWSWDTWG